MHGIIPPSVVNYEWTVKVNDSSFLNVSFPFRVKITKLWFTTQTLWNGNDGLDEGNNIDGSDRILKLAAIKTKNAKTQHSVYDPPTDYTWGFSPFVYGDGPNENLKPTMWLGNPDDAEGRLGAFATGTSNNYWTLSRRSTAGMLVETNNFYNDDWNSSEHTANTYVADVSIMNTDEMLQLFVYNSSGNWDNYENDAKVTISIAYTGVWSENEASATPKEWTSWWND
jgi:hypothetical protein